MEPKPSKQQFGLAGIERVKAIRQICAYHISQTGVVRLLTCITPGISGKIFIYLFILSYLYGVGSEFGKRRLNGIHRALAAKKLVWLADVRRYKRFVHEVAYACQTNSIL